MPDPGEKDHRFLAFHRLCQLDWVGQLRHAVLADARLDRGHAHRLLKHGH
jgi:hypothetical protein